MEGQHNFELPSASQIARFLIYKNVWNFSNKRSFITGLWLREFVNTPLFYNCFLHVLSIKEFPYFKHYYKSIILCTPFEKSLYEQCTDESLIQYSLSIETQTNGKSSAEWQKVKDLQKVLEGEYKKYFPTTRGMIVNYQYNLKEQGKIIGILNRKYLMELRK